LAVGIRQDGINGPGTFLFLGDDAKAQLATRAAGGEDLGREVFSFIAGIEAPFWVNG